MPDQQEDTMWTELHRPSEQRRLERKTYGRIFVMDPARVEEVKEIARLLDPVEWSYYPDGFICAWEDAYCPRDEHDYFELVYGHKFKVNHHKLTFSCWQRGIAIWCVTGYREG